MKTIVLATLLLWATLGACLGQTNKESTEFKWADKDALSYHDVDVQHSCETIVVFKGNSKQIKEIFPEQCKPQSDVLTIGDCFKVEQDPKNKYVYIRRVPCLEVKDMYKEAY